MQQEVRRICGQITYLPATLEPLSADVFFIETDDAVFIYDVGSLSLIHI